MVESCNELIMEIADEIGVNLMGEDDDDEDEKDNSEEDDDGDGGDAVATPTVVPSPIPVPPVAAPEVIVIKVVEEDPMEMVHE
jgi:hypothetical protein